MVCLDVLPHCQGRRFIANYSSDVPFEALIKRRRITLSVILRVLLVRLHARIAASKADGTMTPASTISLGLKRLGIQEPRSFTGKLRNAVVSTGPNKDKLN